MKDILGEIVRLRSQRGWNEYEFAKRAEIPQSTISNWYSKQQTPTIQTLEKVCRAFGITLSQFFAEENDPVSLTSAERKILDCWAALSTKQQELFLALFETMY